MTTCRVCQAAFIPFQPLQQVCGVPCARKMPAFSRKQAKAEAAADRKKLEALKPRSHWLRAAQQAFNAYVRIRDAHLPCVSCLRVHGGFYDAGHYLSVGARPELRFDEANVHKQCVPCNHNLHGNPILMRAELLRRIGSAEVERLEGPHPARKYTVDDLKAIRDTYRQKAKELQ